jgi:parvulin-like peptidyl-prolyl isomerase
MPAFRGSILALVANLALAGPMLSQPPGQAALPASASPVAATVNGQPIPEQSIERALKRIPKERQLEARPDILQHLIDNMLIDQYLQQGGVEITAQQVEAKIEEIRADISKEKQKFEKVLEDLGVTEPELRAQLAAELRWEKYLDTQATDKNLHEVFQQSPEVFDGTMVRARHILLTPPAGNAQAALEAKQKLLDFKRTVEERAAKAVAALPANADNLTRENTQTRAMTAAFADLAGKESACPSKEQGGDVGWFGRLGSMVEPFAKAAFALKPYALSDIVQTQFGYHLILVTERKPGKETKFEEVKELVRDVYGSKLREAICAQLRPQAKILVNAPAKP